MRKFVIIQFRRMEIFNQKFSCVFCFRTAAAVGIISFVFFVLVNNLKGVSL